MKMKMWVVAVLMLLGVGRKGEGAPLQCGDAVSALVPCGTFLLGNSGPSPTAECCKSAASLDRMASTTATRRSMCECLKETGPSFGVKPERAKLLPALCKLKINIPISPNVDCSRVA